MPAVAAKTALSILAMLLGLLQEGVQKLEDKDYPAAIVAFTKVIEHEQADDAMRERATFWRGVAYGKSGKADEAKKDFARILRGSRDRDLVGKAVIAFGQLGGDPETLLPKETPKEAFEKTKKLGLAKSPAVRKRIGGDIAVMLGMSEMVMNAEVPGVGEEIIAGICEEVSYGGSEVGKGEDFGTATVVAMADDMALTVRMVAVGDEWHFDSLIDVKKTGALPVQPEPAAARQVNQLKQVALGLIMSMQDNGGRFPAKLADVQPYVGEQPQLLQFVDPQSGKTTPLLYHSLGELGGRKAGELYLVATPVAVDGKRYVAFADGHVAPVAEAEFLKTAASQGWKVKGAEPAELDEAGTAKVEALVKQLGDPKSAVRKTAYEELKALGEQAVPILEKHRDHADPEVRLTVRKLLEQ